MTARTVEGAAGGDLDGVSALLTAAAEVVERVGLWRRYLWPGAADDADYCEGDPVCLVGALVVAAEASRWGSPRVRVAVKAVARLLGVSTIGVSVWSDAEGRTAAEVAAVLRATVERERGGAR